MKKIELLEVRLRELRGAAREARHLAHSERKHWAQIVIARKRATRVVEREVAKVERIDPELGRKARVIFGESVQTALEDQRLGVDRAKTLNEWVEKELKRTEVAPKLRVRERRELVARLGRIAERIESVARERGDSPANAKALAKALREGRLEKVGLYRSLLGRWYDELSEQALEMWRRLGVWVEVGK